MRVILPALFLIACGPSGTPQNDGGSSGGPADLRVAHYCGTDCWFCPSGTMATETGAMPKTIAATKGHITLDVDASGTRKPYPNVSRFDAILYDDKGNTAAGSSTAVTDLLGIQIASDQKSYHLTWHQDKSCFSGCNAPLDGHLPIDFTADVSLSGDWVAQSATTYHFSGAASGTFSEKDADGNQLSFSWSNAPQPPMIGSNCP